MESCSVIQARTEPKRTRRIDIASRVLSAVFRKRIQSEKVSLNVKQKTTPISSFIFLHKPTGTVALSTELPSAAERAYTDVAKQRRRATESQNLKGERKGARWKGQVHI